MTRAPTLAGSLLLAALTLIGVDHARADAVIVKLRADVEASAQSSLEGIRRRVTAHSVRPLFRRAERSFAPQQQRTREGAALPDLSHVYRVALGPGADAASAAAELGAGADVVWAQPDYPMQPDFVPNDPFFFSSGSWGQPYADLWGLRRIRAPEAWQLTRGEGAVIAVIDTGLDAAHPDIADNLWVNPGEDLDGDGRASDADRNGSDDDGNGLVDDLTGYDFFDDDADPFDENGHGTHVAGIAAAVGGNGLGILGVAPGARVMALKGFPASGPGDASALAEAIVYAARQGADVMNNSWSCSVRCPRNPVFEEAVRIAHALGTVVVTSAGNTADDVVFQSPKHLRETLVVASSREDDSIAPSSGHGLLVDLAAPGAGRDGGDAFASAAILSLLASGAPPEFSERVRVGDAYVRLAGTSQAAPHVAGVVALVRSLRPDVTPEEIRALLRATARDAGAFGHDPVYGAGIVDALAALTAGAPQLRGEIARPLAGDVLAARGGVVAVEGSAGGADFAGYALEFGHGLEPASWQPIPPAGSGPTESGLLARWNVSALADGPYALRLTVTGRSGAQVQEFAPLSLERSRPVPVSLEGAISLAPDVSGALAVYQSERSSTGVDIFAADLRSRRERSVTSSAGAQQQARVSGRRIVYRDTGTQPGGEIRSCLMSLGLRHCHDVPVALGPGQRSAPVVSGPRVLWTEQDADGGESPRLCDFSRDPRACRVRTVAARPERQLDLDVSGRRLAWRELSPVFSLWSCVLSQRGDACPARLVDAASQFQSAPALSGDTVVWEQFNFWPDFGLGSRVNVCRLGADGPCTPAFAGEPSLSEPAPDVSGDTVVWSADAPGEPAAIWFCEHDPASNTCPAQRLAGTAAGARNPAIDGRRVVFEDERDGPARIYALELPDLFVFGPRRVHAGRRLRLEIFGRDPGGARMQLSARIADGSPVESLGMRFAQHPRLGVAQLSWRPAADAAGRYALRFEGAAESGLVTREHVELVVDAPEPPRR